MTAVNIPKDKIIAFCQKWKIAEFALFGSALRHDFHSNSDIDVLVTFIPDAAWSLLDHVQMQDELEIIFGRKVDLLTRRGVEHSRNYLRRQAILDSAQVIYGIS